MPPERSESINVVEVQSGLIVKKYLEDKNSVTRILNNEDLLLDEISLVVGSLDKAGTESLVHKILDGLGRDDEEWNVDRRDAGLHILPLIPLNKIKRDSLTKLYLDSIASQNANSDPYGSIYSLLRAGDLFTDNITIGQETKDKVTKAWDKIASLFQGEDKNFILKAAEGIVGDIPLSHDELLGNPDAIDIGGRDTPDFPEPEKELHDSFLKETEVAKTFKLTLWDNAPRFRDLCKKLDIPLENFWNITDPDKVISALTTIQTVSPVAYDYLARVLKNEMGISLEKLDQEHLRVISDEIVNAGIKAKKELLSNKTDLGSILKKFKNLIEKSKGSNMRAQRYISSQVANFLVENGIEINDININSLSNALSDPVVMEQLKKEFEIKQAAKVEGAEALEREFSLSSRDLNFSLISRRKEDLFLGDLTGDCTSYHLWVGMNAWTMPIWLSNPGFNIYKITNGHKLVAKLGIILGLAEGKPVLVVDSFEVGNGINDEEEAKNHIRNGLSFLKTWAERIGARDVFVNTISNSSDAISFLKDNVQESEVSEMHAIGGLSGIAELRKNLIGKTSNERIYLQSVSWEDTDNFNPGAVENWETENVVAEFEKLISDTITSAPKREKKKIQDLATSQDWEGLFAYMVSKLYPFVAKSVGVNWSDYVKFLDFIEIDELGNAIRTDANSIYPKDELPVRTEILERLIEEASIQEKDHDEYLEGDNRMLEANKVDEILVLIKRIGKVGLTPNLVLKKLYEQSVERVESEDKKKQLYLNRKLPKLV